MHRIWATLLLADIAGILQAVAYLALTEGNMGAAVIAGIVSVWLFGAAVVVVGRASDIR